MPVSPEQLAAIIQNRASQLCSMEGDRKVAQKQSQIREDYNPDVSDYDSDSDQWDSMYLNESPQQRSPQPKDIQYSQMSASGSRMPDAIKNSMLQEKIDVSALGETSVLDKLGIKGPKKQKPNINESFNRQQQAPVQSQSTSVDYSIIKAIVNECLNEYFSKKPINESAGIRTIGLSEGKINIVDNKGNIYSAKLEYKGNRNDKK